MRPVKTFASSFADPKDVAAFAACKATGKTDRQCFKVGDNGIGCWGHTTAQTRVPMCALPPEDIRARWGSVNKGKEKIVCVTVRKVSVLCMLADRMPSKKNITNGCGIDLNPAAAAALKLKPPFKAACEWQWV